MMNTIFVRVPFAEPVKYDVVHKADGTYFDGDAFDKVITKPLRCPLGSPGDHVEIVSVRVIRTDKGMRNWEVELPLLARRNDEPRTPESN